MVGVIVFLVAASLALAFGLKRIPAIVRFPLAIADFIMAALVFVALRQHRQGRPAK